MAIIDIFSNFSAKKRIFSDFVVTFIKKLLITFIIDFKQNKLGRKNFYTAENVFFYLFNT